MSSVTPSESPLHDEDPQLPLQEDTDKKDNATSSDLEKQDKGGTKGWKILDRLDSLFNWIAEMITEQSKVQMYSENLSALELSSYQEVIVKESVSEVIKTAERICESLEMMKKSFIDKADTGDAMSFIAKSIDPMIVHAKKLIQELKKNDNSSVDGQVSVLDKAVDTVVLYASFNDEIKLIRKIINEGVKFTKSAIERDIKHLLGYQLQRAHEIKDIDPRLGIQLEWELKRHLAPILELFHTKTDIVPELNGISEFFEWKKNIDEERANLMDLAYLSIESVMCRFGKSISSRFNEERGISEGEGLIYAPLLDINIEESAKWLDLLAELQNKVYLLQTEIEQNDYFEGGALHATEKYLGEMKQQANSLGEILTDNALIQNSLQDLLEKIKKVENFLREKQDQRFFGED
jgi:hypothetical protein